MTRHKVLSVAEALSRAKNSSRAIYREYIPPILAELKTTSELEAMQGMARRIESNKTETLISLMTKPAFEKVKRDKKYYLADLPEEESDAVYDA